MSNVNDVGVSVVFDMTALEERRKAEGLSMKALSSKITGYGSSMYYDLCLTGGRCNDWELIQKITLWYGDIHCFDYIEPLVKEVLNEMLVEE